MNREEIKQEIVRFIYDQVFIGGSLGDVEHAAEEILQFLEDIGFDYEQSVKQR